MFDYVCVCMYLVIGVFSDEASGGATRAPAPPTAMIYMEPGLSPGYRHEEEEEGKEGLEEAGGRRRGSQPWLRRFLASSLYEYIHVLSQNQQKVKKKESTCSTSTYMFHRKSHHCEPSLK